MDYKAQLVARFLEGRLGPDEIDSALDIPEIAQALLRPLIKAFMAQTIEVPDSEEYQIKLHFTASGPDSVVFRRMLTQFSYTTVRNPVMVPTHLAIAALIMRSYAIADFGSVHDYPLSLFISSNLLCQDEHDEKTSRVLMVNYSNLAHESYSQILNTAQFCSVITKIQSKYEVEEQFDNIFFIDATLGNTFLDVLDAVQYAREYSLYPEVSGFYMVPYTLGLFAHLKRHIDCGMGFIGQAARGSLGNGLEYEFTRSHVIFHSSTGAVAYSIFDYIALIGRTYASYKVGDRVYHNLIEIHQEQGGYIVRKVSLIDAQFADTVDKRIRFPHEKCEDALLINRRVYLAGKLKHYPFSVSRKLYNSVLESVLALEQLNVEEVRSVVKVMSSTITTVGGAIRMGKPLSPEEVEALTQEIYIVAFTKNYEATVILGADEVLKGDHFLGESERQSRTRALISLVAMSAFIPITVLIPSAAVGVLGLAGLTLSVSLVASVAQRLAKYVANRVASVDCSTSDRFYGIDWIEDLTTPDQRFIGIQSASRVLLQLDREIPKGRIWVNGDELSEDETGPIFSEDMRYVYTGVNAPGKDDTVQVWSESVSLKFRLGELFSNSDRLVQLKDYVLIDGGYYKVWSAGGFRCCELLEKSRSVTHRIYDWREMRERFITIVGPDEVSIIPHFSVIEAYDTQWYFAWMNADFRLVKMLIRDKLGADYVAPGLAKGDKQLSQFSREVAPDLFYSERFFPFSDIVGTHGYDRVDVRPWKDKCDEWLKEVSGYFEEPKVLPFLGRFLAFYKSEVGSAPLLAENHEKHPSALASLGRAMGERVLFEGDEFVCGEFDDHVFEVGDG